MKLTGLEILAVSNRISSNDKWLLHCVKLHQEEVVRIGVFARSLRQEAGISGRAMAKQMGISAMFLSEIERGKKGWSDLVLAKWITAMSKL